MNAVLMLFIVFSFLTLIFAAILVASSLSTLMARQIREIGMMKAIGASSSQIARLYLFTMIALSAIAVVLAIPLSRIGASILIRSTARMLNIDILNATMPFDVVVVQIITGILIPLIASLVPVFNGSRITVREALNSYGVKSADFGRRRFDSLLSRTQILNTNLTLAVRNVLRHRGRLWLTVGLLASGGTMFLTALNVSRAWDTNVDRIYQERLYDLEVRFAAPLRSPQETAKKIAAISGIHAAEPWQYSSMSFAQSGHYETNHSYPDSGHGRSFIFGVPPQTKMLNLPLLQGHWLDSADGSEVVMNRAALNFIGLKLGEMVNLSIKGRISSWRVVGFVDEMGSPGPTAYVPLAAYERVVHEQPCCNLLRVAFFDRSEKSTLQNSRPIERILDRDQNAIASIFPMYELRRAISEHMTVLIRSLLALAILMAAIGGIGLASTMSVNVLERTRELGIMRAIGATPKMIGRIVMSEGLMIGAFSLFFAFGLSLLLSRYLGHFIGNMAFRAPLPLVISVGGIVLWIAIVIAGSILATVFPARRASNITTREALAYE
jgi:ABC-type transport system, involved in lipoprotein release, permease component